MLEVILFSYSRGLISSRRIAQACATNITLMSLSGDVQPHFTSIAAFVAKMSEQQTLKPAIEQLEKQLSALNTPDALYRA